MKNSHCKTRNVRFGRETTEKWAHSDFKLRFSESLLVLVRSFLFQMGVVWTVWWSKVIILLKIDHLKNRNVALTEQQLKNDVIQKPQTTIFWKFFRSSKRFLICFWCYLRSAVTRVNHLLENWPSLKKEFRIAQARTEKWRHVKTSN